MFSIWIAKLQIISVWRSLSCSKIRVQIINRKTLVKFINSRYCGWWFILIHSETAIWVYLKRAVLKVS